MLTVHTTKPYTKRESIETDEMLTSNTNYNPIHKGILNPLGNFHIWIETLRTELGRTINQCGLQHLGLCLVDGGQNLRQVDPDPLPKVKGPRPLFTAAVRLGPVTNHYESGLKYP